MHPDLGVTLEQASEGDVPTSLEPLAQSVLAEAMRNAHKHASPTRVSVRVGRTTARSCSRSPTTGSADTSATPGWV